MSDQEPHPLHGLVHHYGYVVEDLEQGVHHLVATLGAGPLVLLRDVPLEGVTSQGEPAEFAHSSAFGHCATFAIEVMEIDRCWPERVREAFAGARPRLHHVAWALPVARVDASRERLETQGMPAYLHAGLGDIDFTYHDASAVLGHDLEVHADSQGFRGFFATIQAASEGWDGRDPIRSPA